MNIKYGGVEYELLDPDKWTTLEAAKLQRASGMTPAELVMDLRNFGPAGLHAIAWVSVRRAGVDVAYDEFDLPYFDTFKAW